MPIRLIALDLDGTLVNTRWEISQKDIETLAAAVARGVQIVVVTGRRPRAAAPYIARLPFPVAMITSNGAMVRTEKEDILYQNFLPRETALKVLAAARSLRPYTVVIFDVPGRGQVVMQEGAVPEGPIGWYLRTSQDHLLLMPQLEEAVTSNPVQIMIGGPPAHISEAESLIRSAPVCGEVKISWTNYPDRNIYIMDVMNRGCSKGEALKFWASHCKIPPSDVMAIGDNFNDVEMLEFAGLPVVMGNHIDGLHREGWALTNHCDESGVACAVEKYVLNI
jgi:hydroxymethylpyrimidine pyrophosphatase-like HAD family hydrolase